MSCRKDPCLICICWGLNTSMDDGTSYTGRPRHRPPALVPQCPAPEPSVMTRLRLSRGFRVVPQSTLPAPSSTSRSFRSHFSLWLLSLFLYQRLIHPATSKPSVGLSATLQRRAGNKEEVATMQGGEYTRNMQFHVFCHSGCTALMPQYYDLTHERENDGLSRWGGVRGLANSR